MARVTLCCGNQKPPIFRTAQGIPGRTQSFCGGPFSMVSTSPFWPASRAIHADPRQIRSPPICRPVSTLKTRVPPGLFRRLLPVTNTQRFSGINVTFRPAMSGKASGYPTETSRPAYKHSRRGLRAGDNHTIQGDRPIEIRNLSRERKDAGADLHRDGFAHLQSARLSHYADALAFLEE